MVASSDNFPLLAELLAEQRRLDTPVARFSEAYDAGILTDISPAPSSLIPLSRPGPGEQYAFEVDLDSCTGCKACVAACHSLNGLDDDETWRDVGLLTGGDHRAPFQQTITTACHHCADPACLNGCPVLAYDKDPATGIVRHLDDQCIGCQYCILKCPYDVPKYSGRRGIVRKCDMCHGRLGVGEAPACVQACPTQAIRITLVARGGRAASTEQETRGAGRGARGSRAEIFLPGAPEPSYTRPTTVYVTARRLPDNLQAGDVAMLRPQPAHWPLAVMLTLMPLAIGTGAAGENGTALAVGGVALAVSVLHLGQPARAWRIFLGWRKSWLSREAILFGAWLAVTGIALGAGWARMAAPAIGVLALFCSAMVYADTRRKFWRLEMTLAGLAACGAVTTAAVAFAVDAGRGVAIALGAATAAAAALSVMRLKPLDRHDTDVLGVPELTSARLLWGPLRGVFFARLFAGLAGGIVLPFLIIAGAVPPQVRMAIPVLCIAAELVERHLFFRAVDAPKMPGMPGQKSE